MKPEYELLFTCTRQDFQEKHKLAAIEQSRKKELNWGEVFSTAEQHGVGPLIYVNLVQNLDQDSENPGRYPRGAAQQSLSLYAGERETGAQAGGCIGLFSRTVD